MPSHFILGGKVRIFRRPNSAYWQCQTRVNGKRRISTKTDSLEHAKDIAENWYLELRGKSRAGLLKKQEKTFAEAAEVFLAEYGALNEGRRSPRWIQSYEIRLRLHLNPYFGKMGLSEINDGTILNYEIHRRKTPSLEDLAGGTSADDDEGAGKPKRSKPPARSTIHDEIVTIRQVLKTAVRHKWLSHVPDLTQPYKRDSKVTHRPWFSPEEYKKLYEATRAYTKTCLARDRWNAEQVHDFVLLMANTGLRPDEAKNLEHRDITIVKDKATRETILEIDVRGKVGVRPCKSMPGAVLPYERLRDRLRPLTKKELKTVREGGPEPSDADRKPQPTDRVFPGNHIKLFNGVLTRAGLKFDRDGKPRTAYSLRHSYICFRLMEGAPVWDVAMNTGTSVEMIEKHYAKHIKNRLDTTRINVRQQKLVDHEKVKGPLPSKSTGKKAYAGRQRRA